MNMKAITTVLLLISNYFSVGTSLRKDSQRFFIDCRNVGGKSFTELETLKIGSINSFAKQLKTSYRSVEDYKDVHALVMAAKHGHWDKIYQMLLEKPPIETLKIGSVNSFAKQRSVEEDYKDVHALVMAGKCGHWDKIYPILIEKPYLVNMIPEGESWAVLHIAVASNNKKLVEWLLNKCKSCDPLVLTKEDTAHKAGLTPADIAHDPRYPRPEIEKILNSFTEEQRKERFGTFAPYFISAIDGERMNKEGLPLLLMALSGYKQTFHPDKVKPHEPFNDILKEIAAYQHEGTHWTQARDKIAAAMKGFCMKKSIDISTNDRDEDAFYESIVKLYTNDGGNLYHYVNLALRRESTSKKLQDYKPEGDDLAIAPYTLMLDVVLFCWKKLPIFKSYSYRGMGLSRADTLDKYRKGISFVWLQFVSSSTNMNVAVNFGRRGAKNMHYVLFVMDNSVTSRWQPRDISSYSSFPKESEVLYPAGSEFEVQHVAEEAQDGDYKYTAVHLQLCNPL